MERNDRLAGRRGGVGITGTGPTRCLEEYEKGRLCRRMLRMWKILRLLQKAP